MNKLSTQQKTYFAISLIAVLILGGITIFQKSNFVYKDTTDYAKLKRQQQLEAAAYAQYLASIKTDPKASQRLFQTILTQSDIKAEVEAELQTSQPVNPPAVDEKSLNIVASSGQKAVESYLTAAVAPLVGFNQNAAELNKQLFVDAGSTEAAVKQYKLAFKKLNAAPVPKEALDAQKALVSAYASYGRLLDVSKQYATGQTADPWAQVYQQYAAMNQSFKTFSAGYNQLVAKYKIAGVQITIPANYADGEPPGSGHGLTLIPKARAFLGLGDVTITIGDIPSLIMDAIKQGLTSSFSQFMSSFLDKLIAKIESNYKIANFLYYSDALISGQYADDYLNKYVSDNVDRQVIKQLIPQFSCNAQNQTLKPIFQAKANQYLGFDPKALDPKDPNYYQKLSSVGDFLSSPQGWQIYYQDLANQAESASQQAIDRELTSSGLKSPRDALGGAITSSINSIVSGEKASLESILQLGITNASSFVSQFVAQITQTLVTKFLFSGATTSPRGGPGAVGVLKEQATCLAAAQLTAIVPVSGTQYQQPPPPPSSQSIYQNYCDQFPEACNPPSQNGNNP